MVEGRADLTGK